MSLKRALIIGAMKILSLFFLLLSIQAFAGHDWQYSVEHPDGKVETKNITDPTGFFFQAGEHVCEVSEPEDFDDAQKFYDLKCSSAEAGFLVTIPRLQTNEEFRRVWGSVVDMKGKTYKFEVLAYNHFSKKSRRPFSDNATSKAL